MRLVVIGGAGIAAGHDARQLTDVVSRIEPGQVLLHVADNVGRLFRHCSTLRSSYLIATSPTQSNAHETTTTHTK